jgi:dTDP-4-amino-4,6-dideoxygalactose transaminase
MSAPPLSFIPISVPRLGEEVEDLVLDVLRSGRLAQGKMVARFEELCATMAGTRHAVAVCNGTVALEAALSVLGLREGDEVITTPFTFAATLNAVLRAGATARFADIRSDFTLDPAQVGPLINSTTKAIIPVHLYGLMCDMDEITRIASRHDLHVIEDAAQAHGAEHKGRRAGSFGLGCFSFYATKNVTCGEGGVVTTNDDKVAEQLRIQRNQGMRARYEHIAVGQNLRMTEVQAAIGIPQLERLSALIEHRQRNAQLLSEIIESAGCGVTVPTTPQDRVHVWHQYTVLVPPECDRERVLTRLRESGIGADVYYPRLVWDHEAYRGAAGVARDSTPHAAVMARRCLSLPVHPSLTEQDVQRVGTALVEAVTA